MAKACIGGSAGRWHSAGPQVLLAHHLKALEVAPIFLPEYDKQLAAGVQYRPCSTFLMKPQ